MKWRFTLYDRFDTATVIKEPVGWDAIKIKVKRDLDMHGIIFDYQGNDFTFFGPAAFMIKAENDTYGVQGLMTISIEQNCKGSFVELYRGRLLFPKYKYTCGSGKCSVNIPIETTSDVMELTNKWDQKVDLYKLKGFDESTELTPYEWLGKEIQLPGKGVFVQDVAINEVLNALSTVGCPDADIVSDPEGYTYGTGIFELGFTKTKAAEIGGAEQNTQPFYTHLFNDALYYNDISLPLPEHPPAPYDDLTLLPDPGTLPDYRPYMNHRVISPNINYAREFPNYGLANNGSLAIRAKGRIIAIGQTEIPMLVFVVLRVKADGSYDYVNMQVIRGKQSGSYPLNITFPLEPKNETIEFDCVYNNPAFVLNPDDKLYICMPTIFRQRKDDIDDGQNAFRIELDTQTAIDYHTISQAAATPGKIFLINETASRVAEAVTNDKIRVYSEYFGRTDSQPYAMEGDGCGGLEAVTNGLHIRGQEARNDQTPTLPISMKDIWEGVEPIHHIGFGIENDVIRGDGFKRLRIENWKYFYKSDVVMNCSKVAKIETETIEKEHYSTFEVGYDKWEAEEYTGLDECITSRIYRTMLSSLRNPLVKMSKFVASPYAYEITRRKGANDSKDWRYDNDYFILCLNRAGDGVIVEQGNIIDPENIIDPPTMMNFRISPARNALRWLDKVLASYKTQDANSKLIFTDGKANYNAAGLLDDGEPCRPERIKLNESQSLSVHELLNEEGKGPFQSPERVRFEYPMSAKDFKALLADPYGVVFFDNDCELGLAWIDEIEYTPEKGKANFTLIPAYGPAASAQARIFQEQYNPVFS